MNVFIVGVNQITDVEIDRVNKPELPIAAGDLSPAAARRIVARAVVIPVVLALTQGVGGARVGRPALAIGAAYSCRRCASSAAGRSRPSRSRSCGRSS